MPKTILLSLAVIAALVLLTFAVFNQKAPTAQSFRRPDGTVVTFIEADYGSNQTVVWGKPFQRSLYKILPAKLKSWSGASEHSFTTSQTNNPVFWLHETSPMTNNGSGYLTIRLLDEFGCEYDANGWSMGEDVAPPDGRISHYQLDAMDPHGKIAGFFVYESEAKAKTLARIMIPGAAFSPLPTPQQPLAPTVQDGEFAFQLMSLATGLKSVPISYTKMTNGVLFTQATFRIAKNGAPAPNWFAENVKVTDARGKTFKFRVHGRGFREGDSVFNFEGALDPAAGPFKLRVEFIHQSKFSPDELTVITNVPFPAVSETLSPGSEFPVPGGQLILENIYGANAPRPVNFFQPGQPLILARLASAANSVHLQLERAVNESGAEMALYAMAPMYNGEYYFSFAPRAKAKTMDLTFAVHKSRYAEFEAQPVLFSTNGPPKN